MSADVLEQVALVTGQILYAGTGEPVIGKVHITVKEGQVIDKVLQDGTFVISGPPELLFPNLSSQPYSINLMIRADSAQFEKGFSEQSISVTIPMDWTFDSPVSKQQPASTSTIQVLFPANPADILPVNIRGYVFETATPGKPIPNATVEVLQSSSVPHSTTTSTNDQGRYHFDDISVVAPAQIRCSATDFKTETRILEVDFIRRINEEYFRLAPS